MSCAPRVGLWCLGLSACFGSVQGAAQEPGPAAQVEQAPSESADEAASESAADAPMPPSSEAAPPPRKLTPPAAAGSRASAGADGGEAVQEDEDDDAPDPDSDAEHSIAGSRVDALPGDPWGDPHGDVAAGPFSLRVLLQTRYTATFAEPSRNPRPSYRIREDNLVQRGDGWELQRAFLRLAADTPGDLSFRIILDFAELAQGNTRSVVKQAWATYRLVPKRIEVTAGLFKLPFSILELDPIRKFEFADPGELNSLTRRLGYGGRDVGAQIMVAPLAKPRHLRMWLGAFRGNSRDENDSPVGAFGGRLESRPGKRWRIGVDGMLHPWERAYLRPFNTSRRQLLPAPPDPLFPAQQGFDSGAAGSADITYQRAGLMLRGEGMLGRRLDVFTRGDARSFVGAWGLVAYRFRTGTVRPMPALRLEWLDADRENPGGQRIKASVALTLLTSKNTRLLFDVTRTWVEPNSPLLRQPLPLADPLYLELDNTRIVGQLQVEL